MKDALGQTPEFFSNSTDQESSLWRYVQSMDPGLVSQLSRPASAEVMQMMEHNIIGLLGGLPSQNFEVTVTTDRDSLGRLLASAMMSGYFLRGAEQRMTFEQALTKVESPEA